MNQEDLNTDDESIIDDDNNQENQFLTFTLGKEDYAINILNVVEIIRMLKITPIPETMTFIKGIINLRGKIIPIMDVRLRFGLEEKEHDDRTCIIVVHIRDVEIGLIVDAVSEVTEIESKYIEEMPDINKGQNQRYVKGLGKINNEVKVVLDMSRLLFDEEIEALKGSTDT